MFYSSAEELLVQIFEKFDDDIVNALDIVFDQIDAVFRTVSGSVDGMLGGVWGTGVIKVRMPENFPICIQGV